MSKVLRDNKVLLQKIKKNTLLSDRCAMMSSSVGFAFSFKVDDYVVSIILVHIILYWKWY